MKLLVISDAHIIEKQGKKVAYAPYVKEMNLWMRLVDHTVIVCPNKLEGTLLAQPFKIQNFKQVGLRRLEFHNVRDAVVSFLTTPYQALVLWNQMRKANHIHLRCPGNLGLLACFVQILFPWKRKTAKYAGNWDPKAKQPFAYNLQKWILSSTLLTRNIDVLVYGEWNQNNKNSTPFFTASYGEKDIEKLGPRSFDQPLRALFVGKMGENKRPYETVQLIESLNDMGLVVYLDMYGEGNEVERIKKYIIKNNLEHLVTLHGNQPAEVVKKAYQRSHLLFLLSKSEGWPKVVAEGMFWGLVPVATSVSAVPWMLGGGSRGFLIANVNYIKKTWLVEMLSDSKGLLDISKNAQQWSRQYTLESFESAIKKILE